MKKILYTFLISLFTISGYSQNSNPKSDSYTNTIPSGYSLVWQDEFNEGVLPDKEWWFETGNHGWGNNELQNYVDRSLQKDTVAKIQDGILTITALKLDKPYQGSAIISARMNTVKSWKYGYFEARAKVPGGKGTWAAFWMMPQHFTAWPLDGEIDIMEYVGYRPDVTQSSIHTDLYNHTIHTEKTATKDIKNAETEFHVYALEWTADQITGYVDGVAYFTFKNDHLGDKRTWPFDAPFYLKLNLAIGGNWGGLEGVEESIFPSKYEIDYVRVYQKKEIASIEEEASDDIPFTFNKENKLLSLHLKDRNITGFDIRDMQGRLYKDKSIEDDHESIDCSDLPHNGVYILTLKGSSVQENYKFIN